MIRSAFSATVLSIALLLSVPAHANSGELMNFVGLGNLQAVGNFYNGGGLPNTPNYGVSFSSNFFGLKPESAGGDGNFSGTPLTCSSGQSCPIIFIDGTYGTLAKGVMNVAPGFSSGINFVFSAAFTGGQTETVTLWSGANGTGTVLATVTLANNDGSCSGTSYCNWSQVGLSFSGTARSVTFNGPADALGLTDITLGSSKTAVPEPSAIYLIVTGLGAISFTRLRRFFGV